MYRSKVCIILYSLVEGVGKSLFVETIEKIFGELEEWGVQFQDLKSQCVQLVANCEYFGMKLRDHQSIPIIFGELEKTVSSLKGMGKKVYIILDSPTGVEVDPKHLCIRTFSSPVSKNGHPLSEREFIDRDKNVRDKLVEISQNTGAILVDPLKWLCENGNCISENADGPIRCDESHLRPDYVRNHVTYLDCTVKP